MGPLLLLALVTGRVAAQSPDALRPGDAVRIRVFREPELTGEFTVNERGVVALPRLGDVPIADWPSDSIRPRITRSLSAFLRDAVIEVVVLRRIAITGSVFKPGLYPVDATMTIADVLALAGGPTPDGRRDQVQLLRNGTVTVYVLQDRGTPAVLRSGDRLHVAQRGWVARNTWLVGSLIGALATVTAVLAR